MTAETLIASLQLSMPELILAVGAMALLMIGVFSSERATPTVTGLAVAVLIIAGLWLVLKTGEGGGLWRRLPVRSLRQIHESARSHRFDHSDGDDRRSRAFGSDRPV